MSSRFFLTFKRHAKIVSNPPILKSKVGTGSSIYGQSVFQVHSKSYTGKDRASTAKVSIQALFTLIFRSQPVHADKYRFYSKAVDTRLFDTRLSSYCLQNCRKAVYGLSVIPTRILEFLALQPLMGNFVSHIEL